MKMILCYIPLVEIKDFNALIDNKPFFDQPVKNKQEVLKTRKLAKCQERMIIQQETCYSICAIKNITNSLTWFIKTN